MIKKHFLILDTGWVLSCELGRKITTFYADNAGGRVREAIPGFVQGRDVALVVDFDGVGKDVDVAVVWLVGSVVLPVGCGCLTNFFKTLIRGRISIEIKHKSST